MLSKSGIARTRCLHVESGARRQNLPMRSILPPFSLLYAKGALPEFKIQKSGKIFRLGMHGDYLDTKILGSRAQVLDLKLSMNSFLACLLLIKYGGAWTYMIIQTFKEGLLL